MKLKGGEDGITEGVECEWFAGGSSEGSEEEVAGYLRVFWSVV